MVSAHAPAGHRINGATGLVIPQEWSVVGSKYVCVGNDAHILIYTPLVCSEVWEVDVRWDV